MLATPEINHYSWLGKESWSQYAQHHGYQFTASEKNFAPKLHINWSKIELVKQRLSQTSAKYLLLVDADCFVFDPGRPIDSLKQKDKQLIFSRDTSFPSPVILDLKRLKKLKQAVLTKLKFGVWHLPNAGFILMEVGDYSRWFFERWLHLARNEMSNWASIHPRNQNVLWRGMIGPEADKLGMLQNEVVRLTRPKQMQYLDEINPFAVHFRHKSLSAKDIKEALQDRLSLPSVAKT